MFEITDIEGFKVSFPVKNLLLVEEATWGTILTMEMHKEVKKFETKEKYSSVLLRYCALMCKNRSSS